MAINIPINFEGEENSINKTIDDIIKSMDAMAKEGKTSFSDMTKSQLASLKDLSNHMKSTLDPSIFQAFAKDVSSALNHEFDMFDSFDSKFEDTIDVDHLGNLIISLFYDLADTASSSAKDVGEQVGESLVEGIIDSTSGSTVAVEPNIEVDSNQTLDLSSLQSDIENDSLLIEEEFSIISDKYSEFLSSVNDSDMSGATTSFMSLIDMIRGADSEIDRLSDVYDELLNNMSGGQFPLSIDAGNIGDISSILDMTSNLDSAKEELQNIRDLALNTAVAISGVDTFDSMVSSVNGLYNAFIKAVSAEEQLKESGNATGSQLLEANRNVEASYDALKSKLNLLSKILQTSLSSAQAAGNDALTEKLQGYIDLLNELYTTAEKVNGERISGPEINISSIASGIGDFVGGVAKGFNIDSTPLANFVSTLKNYISTGNKAGAVGYTLASSVRGFINVVKSGISSVNNFKDSIGSKMKSALSNFGGALTKGFKFLMRYGLGIRSTYFLVRKLRSAISSGMTSLAAANSTVQQQLYNFKAVTSALQIGAATALQPVLAAIQPILSTLVSGIAAVSKAVATFLATLTGQKQIYVASGNIKKYSSALSDAADSTKDATDSAKELQRQTASFDEMNVLSDTSSSGSDSGSGGGSSSTPDYSSAITTATVDADSSASNFAEKIKEAWEKSDFTEVGEIIGSKLIEALESIPWDTIESYGTRIATDFATLINGFVGSSFNGTDLGTAIGTFFGKGINAWTHSVNTFFEKCDFNAIGTQLGIAFDTMFDTIDWVALGQYFTNKWNAIFQVLNNFFANVNWTEAGENLMIGIRSFFENIDWESIKGTFSGALGSIGDIIDAAISKKDSKGQTQTTLPELIAEFVENAINSIDWSQLGIDISGIINLIADTILNFDIGTVTDAIYDFFTGAMDGMDWGAFWAAAFKLCWDAFLLAVNIIGDIAMFIIDGLFEGILAGISGLGKWLKTNLVDPFVKWIKDLFGIASPSKVMSEIGGFIIDGLFGGIIDALVGIGTWVKTNLFDPFWNGVTSAFSNVKKWFSELFKDAKDGILKVFNWDNMKKTFTGIWTSIQDTFKTVKTWFSDLFKGAKEKITSVFNWTNLKKTFTDIWDGIKSVFKDTASWFEKTFSEAWTKVKNVFSTGGKVFDGIKDGIVSAFKTIVNALINGINKVVATPFKAINTALSTIKNVSILGAKPFSGLIHTIDIPKIPTLAQGAVIPANKEFLAVLGDQKQGTNVEAPLDTIKQALAEVYKDIGTSSANQTLDITLQVGDRQLYRWIKKMENKEKMVFNG